jgi:Protein of unknown function (DUF1761)
MMHNHITIVVAGAAAHFVTGWVLNSHMLLGKVWKEEKEKKAPFSKDMRINFAAQAVASLVLAIAVAVAISIFDKAQVASTAKTALEKLAGMFFSQEHSGRSMMNSIHTVLFIWAGFLLPVSAQEVIWCGKQVKHFALEAVMELLSLVAIAATVTYLS